MAKKKKKTKKKPRITKKQKKQRKANPKYQDSLFRALFSKPENAIELYNALEGTNYGPDTQVSMTTLKEIFFNDRKNDLSFVIDSHYVVLTEHQTTISKNMPLRFLGYAARTLEKMVLPPSIYSSAQQRFPIPEFYVLYTGDRPWKDETLRLSDGFLRRSDDEEIPENSLELVVKVIDVRYNENNELIRRSKTLEGYSRLIHYIKENRKDGMSREASVDAAIDRCAAEGFLSEFLKDRKEVSHMILGNKVSMEEYGQVMRENGWRDGVEDGREQGRAQERSTIIQNMKAAGMTTDEIARTTGLPAEEIDQL